jgi:hypothetical protein
MRKLLTRVWPILSIAAGVLGGILLEPAELGTSWWPSTGWAQHAATGFLIGVGGILIGMALGVLTGSFKLGFLQYDNGGPIGKADEVDEIRQKIVKVGDDQKAINKTAIEALTLANKAMDMVIIEKKG